MRQSTDMIAYIFTNIAFINYSLSVILHFYIILTNNRIEFLSTHICYHISFLKAVYVYKYIYLYQLYFLPEIKFIFVHQ